MSTLEMLTQRIEKNKARIREYEGYLKEDEYVSIVRNALKDGINYAKDEINFLTGLKTKIVNG